MVLISRKAYAEIYGPTKGDMVRLGDTELIAEIEHDYAVPGDELTSGAGKSMRDGEGYQTSGTYASGALDMVIHNATIIDAILGIVKGDIGTATDALSASERPAILTSWMAFIQTCGPAPTPLASTAISTSPLPAPWKVTRISCRRSSVTTRSRVAARP